MAPPAFDYSRLLRWCIISLLVLTSAAVWPTAMDSTIAKGPLFVFGSTCAAALLLSAILRDGRWEIPSRTAMILLGAHLALFAFSAWWSYDPVYTSKAFLFGISSLLVFWVASHAYSSREHVTRLLRAITWLTVGLCTIGMLQYLDVELFSFTFFIGPEKRVPSLLGSSIAFGSYLVLAFPLLLAHVLANRRNNRSSSLHFGLLAAVILMLFLTQTRSAVFGLIASMTVFALLTVRFKKLAPAVVILILAIAGGTILITVVRPDIGARFSQMFSESPKSSFARRIYFWKAGKDALLASPVVGHGMGSYERTVFDYRSPDYWMVSSEDVVPHAHNELIEIGVEYGLLGLLLSVALVGLVVRRGIAVVRTGKAWERWMAAGIVSAIAGIAVDNLANVTLRQPPIAMFAWLLMGLLFSRAFSAREQKASTLLFASRPRAAVVPLIVWVLLALFYGRAQLKVVDAEVHLGQAMLDRERHNRPAANKGYQAAVTANPGNLMARWHLTQGYLDQFQWENALRSVEELQQLSPRYPQSSVLRAFALFRLQRYPEALNEIERELRQRSHPFAYLIQASIYRALADEQKEREAIVRLLRKDIEAGQPFAYRSSSQRLVQVSKSEEHFRENRLLFDSLETIVPDGHDFFLSLKELHEMKPSLSKP